MYNWIMKYKMESIYIWGAGVPGCELYKSLKIPPVRIIGFVDNYLDVPSAPDLRNIVVLRPGDLPRDCFVVIAAPRRAYDIRLELMELGFSDDRILVWKTESATVQNSPTGNDALILGEVFKTLTCRSLPNNVLTLETSDRCNLLCAMCGYQKRCLFLGEHKGREPKFDCTPIKEVMNTVKTLVLNIAGEPLLNGAIWDVLDPLEQSGYGDLQSIQFHTNGQLLDRNDNIRRLAELPIPLTVSVSVDAVSEKTYRRIRGADFDHLLDNLQQMLAAFRAAGRKNDNLQINSTLLRENIEEFPEFIRMANRLGFKSVITRPMSYKYDIDFSYMRSDRNGFDFDYDQQALQYYPQLTKRIVSEAKAVAEELDMELYIDDAFEVSVFGDCEDLPYPVPADEFWRIIGDRKQKEAQKTALGLSVQKGERIPMKRRCYRPWTDVSIQKDGGVCMCLWLAGKLIGNINEAPFGEIWNSERAQQIRQDMIDGYLPDVCEQSVCKYRQEAIKAYMENRR